MRKTVDEVGTLPRRPDERAPGPPEGRARRFRVYFVLVPLFFLLLLWLDLFYQEGAFRLGPNGKSFGGDFAMFVGAAAVVQHGGNPYDHSQLLRAENAQLRKERLPTNPHRELVRVGNPPLFFWLLRPFTSLPYELAGYIWILAMFALSAFGFLAMLKYLGWRSRLLPLLFFLLMPQQFFGPYYGNNISLVFAGLAAGMLVLQRYPVLAGLLLTLAWLKPQVALPIVLLVWLFHAPHRKPFVLGFIAGSVLLAAGTLATTGSGSLMAWTEGLLGYARDIAQSPDIASISGLYVRWAPHTVRLVLQVVTLGAAGAATVLAWRRFRGGTRPSFSSIAWLWVVWFLAAPYAHFSDEVLLTLPLLVILGRDGQPVRGREAALALYAAALSLILLQAAPFRVQLLCLPLFLLLWASARLARNGGPQLSAMEPIPALSAAP